MPSSAYGAITHLKTPGGLEKFLIESPSLTFWRFQHLQYTNFAVDYKSVHLEGSRTSWSHKLDREGDLLDNHMYLMAELPALATNQQYIDSVGQLMIKQVELSVGNNCIKSFTGAYLYCWEELSGGTKKLEEMTLKYGTDATAKNAAKTKRTVFVPLPFFGSTGNALPLIALQYHNVKVSFQMEEIGNIATNGAQKNKIQEKIYVAAQNGVNNGEAGDALQWHDITLSLLYGQVYLSEDERSRFADLAVEMLITQVQAADVMVGQQSITSSQTLNFNHSVSELIWAVKNAKGKDLVAPFKGNTVTATAADYDVLTSADMKLNNNPRWDSSLPMEYYRLVQPYQAHSSIPKAKVYCYNFGLHPEEDQPSGAINLSRIDKVTFRVTADAGTLDDDAELHVFARNYNILVVKDGLGGLMYSS
jgi:hypothetical protein